MADCRHAGQRPWDCSNGGGDPRCLANDDTQAETPVLPKLRAYSRSSCMKLMQLAAIVDVRFYRPHRADVSGVPSMAATKHSSSEHHHNAASHHEAAAHHHRQAAHHHDNGRHDQAREHAGAASEHSSAAHGHTSTAHSHSHK